MGTISYLGNYLLALTITCSCSYHVLLKHSCSWVTSYYLNAQMKHFPYSSYICKTKTFVSHKKSLFKHWICDIYVHVNVLWRTMHLQGLHNRHFFLFLTVNICIFTAWWVFWRNKFSWIVLMKISERKFHDSIKI